MKINGVYCLNFMGKIIDSHAHVGKHEQGRYVKSDLDIFVKSELPNKDTVEKMIVSDLDVLHGIKNEFEGNKLTLETFKNKDIIVAKDTNNEMMEQIKQASGIIVEAEDMNCHAAIVGLSLDIPVLIGVENALEFLKTSAYVELDAENGIISAN